MFLLCKAWMKQIHDMYTFRHISKNQSIFFIRRCTCSESSDVVWSPSEICALDFTALPWSKWSSCWHDQNIPGTIIFQVQKKWRPLYPLARSHCGRCTFFTSQVKSVSSCQFSPTFCWHLWVHFSHISHGLIWSCI